MNVIGIEKTRRVKTVELIALRKGQVFRILTNLKPEDTVWRRTGGELDECGWAVATDDWSIASPANGNTCWLTNALALCNEDGEPECEDALPDGVEECVYDDVGIGGVFSIDLQSPVAMKNSDLGFSYINGGLCPGDQCGIKRLTKVIVYRNATIVLGGVDKKGGE